MTVWKYLTTGKVRHQFLQLGSYQARCGVAPMFPTNDWKTDKEGLEKLPRCRGCAYRVLKEKEVEKKEAEENAI